MRVCCWHCAAIGRLGNEYDLVGRFFMEHLHVPAGHLLAAPGSSRAFYVKARRDGMLLRGAIAPTAAARDRHWLPSTSIGIEPVSFSFAIPFCGWPPPVTFGPIRLDRSLRGGGFAAIAEALKFNAERACRPRFKWQTWNVARAALARAGASKTSHEPDPHPLYSLYFRAEQTPNSMSRMVLSERRDALGSPEIKLDWRISKSDIDAIPAWLELFDADLRSRGIGSHPPKAGTAESSVSPPHGHDAHVSRSAHRRRRRTLPRSFRRQSLHRGLIGLQDRRLRESHLHAARTRAAADRHAAKPAGCGPSGRCLEAGRVVYSRRAAGSR
jgi:hypothetical protein